MLLKQVNIVLTPDDVDVLERSTHGTIPKAMAAFGSHSVSAPVAPLRAPRAVLMFSCCNLPIRHAS